MLDLGLWERPASGDA